MKVIEKNATVYKVVTVKAGKRLSYVVGGLPPSWVVEYRRGRWAYPAVEGSALFAYKEDPGFYSRHSRREERELWVATADIVDGELSHGGRVLVTWAFNLVRSLTTFWRNPAEYYSECRGETAGVWCKRIKLVRLA